MWKFDAGDAVPDAECDALLHASHGYLCIADGEARIGYMSRAPLGRSVGWYVGKSLVEIVAEGQRSLVLDALEQLRNGAPVVELEARGAISGHWYSLRIAGVRDRGSVRGFAMHALDIDARKRSEAETMMLRSRLHAAANAPHFAGGGVAEVQRRFDLMADALPVLISYVDKDHRYQFNNSAYERWFRTSREELRGRDVVSVLGAAAYEQIRAYIDEALAGRAVSFEITVPYQEAGSRQVVAHYVPDVAPSGQIEGFYALIDDVTHRRAAESALRERDDELRQLQKMEALGRLAGGMAHDFANLLHVVTTSCETVLHVMSEDRPERKDVLRIRNAADRGASLTRQLLSFSRKSDVEAAPLDMNAVLRDMQLVFERLLGSRISVEFDLGSRSLILADAGQIQQILLNLAINARDAMPDGGRLRLTSARVEGPQAADERGALRAGTYAMVSVTDTGTGTDAATVARVFDPFFTTKPPGHGTGLGLSSVYGIVQSLRGHIEVESAVGEGTTLRVYLPSFEASESLRFAE